jgi:hypothetical protein
LQVTFFVKFSNLSNLQYEVNKSSLPSLLLWYSLLLPKRQRFLTESNSSETSSVPK